MKFLSTDQVGESHDEDDRGSEVSTGGTGDDGEGRNDTVARAIDDRLEIVATPVKEN